MESEKSQILNSERYLRRFVSRVNADEKVASSWVRAQSFSTVLSDSDSQKKFGRQVFEHLSTPAIAEPADLLRHVRHQY